MSVLSPLSDNETAPSALDVFHVFPNQVAIKKHYQEDIRAVSQFTGVEAPLEFETSLQGDAYCELKSSRLFLKVKVLHADGSQSSETEKVSPCNAFFHAMFKKVDVYMNRTLVSSSGVLYPYKAYFNRLFRPVSTLTKSRLEATELFTEREGSPNETSPNGGNYRIYKRHQLSKGSRQFDMVGLPLSDILELDRYLINGVHLRLVLHRNNASFCLLSGGDDGDQLGYQVKIDDAFLGLYKLKVNPAIHSKLLKSVTAKYPYIRSETKCANIASGQSVFTWDHINSSYLPKFVIVAFLESSAVLGSLKKNPFNFDHLDLRQICLYVNGIALSGTPINADYGKGLTTEVLDRLYGVATAVGSREQPLGGISGKDRSGLTVSREDVKHGQAIYVFDMAPVIEDNFHFELLQTGTLSLNVKFGVSLAQNVACIFYAEYDVMFEIDESRVVKML